MLTSYNTIDKSWGTGWMKYTIYRYIILMRNTKIYLNIKKSEREKTNLRLVTTTLKGMYENRWKGYMVEFQRDSILYLDLGESIQILNISLPFTPHTYFIKILVASQLSYWTIRLSPKHIHRHACSNPARVGGSLVLHKSNSSGTKQTEFITKV